MATVLKFSLFCIQICIIYAASSAFSDILDDSKVCEEKCTKSFAPHTYPNGSDSSSCMRGCRLYTVTNFVTADEPEHTNTIDDNGLSPAKLLCYRSCLEAYNETSSSTTTCKVGCDTQEILSLKRNAEKVEPDSGIHLMKPVMQVREVVSKVVGMLRIIQSSLTTYFLRDDNKMVAMEGPVEVVVQVVPPSEVQNEAQKKWEDEVLSSPSEANEEESIPEMIVSSGTASIECLSKKVGVPPYLLIISLVSFIIFLTYIIFVICSSNKKKQKKMKSSLPIPTHALPVKLVRPEDLTKLSLMDEEETHAPGFTTKVKLPENTIV